MAFDAESIHFIVSGGMPSGSIDVVTQDFRSAGRVDASTLLNSVARQLEWPSPFALSVSRDALSGDGRAAYLKKLVDDYLAFEGAEIQRGNRLVRINPIFRARNLLLDEKLCFVLMPFNGANYLQEVYSDHVKPTVEVLGLTCRRADDIYDTTLIVETIWEQISTARIVLADLTGRNPNVFYELGIAHTVGKEVILLSQTIDDVPFDLRHLRVILYETNARGTQNLQKQLNATLQTILARPA